MNRLAGSTSPYLLQHKDNPVDWQPWGDEAFAEARRREVPVLVSIGYAACHWCHVMAHESFEDAETADVPQRALRRREGRPRGAPRRRRGLHGGDHRADRARRLADDGVHHAGGPAVLLRAPTSRRPRGTGCPRSVSCSRRSRRHGASGATRWWPPASGSSRRWPRGPWSVPARVRSRRPRSCSTTRCGRCRRRTTAFVVGSATRPSSRRRWCSRCCCDTTPAPVTRTPADGRAHLRGDGARRHLRPARRWLRALLRRRRLGGAALREDAVRQRVAAAGLHAPVARDRLGAGPAGGAGDRRLDAARPADSRGRLRLGAGRGHRRGRGADLCLDTSAAGRGPR